MAAASQSLFASVVFLRIEEFGGRSATEQARLRAQLEAVVAVTAAGLAAEDRAVLEAADGMAVVVLGDPVGALRLAEGALHGVAAGLPLGVGLNHGAVRTAEDGLAGDGIAVAAELARFTAAGQLFASRAFREALAEAAPGAEALLLAKGMRNDAGLRAHELFAPEHAAPRRRSARYFAASVMAALILVGAAIGWRIAAEGQQAFAERVVAKAGGWLRAVSGKAGF